MNKTHQLMHRLPLFRAVMIASLFATANGFAQSIGQWDFNSGTLAGTAGSTLGDLQYADTATQTGTAFGTTTSLGIPDINGTPANVMRFPAATNTMGYSMTCPGPNGGSSGFVNEYTIIFDLLYPSNGVTRPLLDIGDTIPVPPVVGPEFMVDASGGIGVPPTGPFDGLLTPNTWNRIGFTVNTTEIRKYINGLQVGSQPHANEGRLALPANNFVTILAAAVGDAGLGYVNSIQLRDAALSSSQMAAIGGPSAAGIPVTIPAIPSYVQSWTPPGSVARTTTDLGAVIFTGEASVATNTIVLKLNGVAQTGVQISSNGVTGLITVFKPNSGALAAGTTYTLEINYTDSQVGAKVYSTVFKAALLFEDFELLALGTNIEEGLPAVYTNVWTKTPPPGWTVDDSGMPNYVMNDLTNNGMAEWNGWSFAAKTFWGVVTDNQDRRLFTLAQGTVAVADNDEWDDQPHPTFDTNGNALYFNSYLTTPTINIAGVPANSIFMNFDSSWRPEGFDDWGDTNNQTALITASYNGGAPIEVLRWDSQDGGPYFHGYNVNERVSVLLNNPAGATNLVVKIGALKAANDWWWAFDNLEINIGDVPSSIVQFTPAQGAANVTSRPQIGAVINPGTTTINTGTVQLLLDGTTVAATITTNAQNHLVISGPAPTELRKLSTHTNTLTYSDSLNGLQTTNWTFTVMDNIVQLIPNPGAVNVGPRPQVGAILNPGGTTMSPASIQLLFDGVNVPVTVTTNAQTNLVVSGRVASTQPKLSTHTNILTYSDSLNGLQTTNWTFTIADYPEITLGTPVWMEEFNGVYEATFPAGWVATNRTSVLNTNFNLNDPDSAAYENFVVVSTNRLGAVFGARRFNVAPQTLNGQVVDYLMEGNLVYGESDNRGGEQVQVLFSPVINLTGISNVRLGFNSIYEQNQDSMGGVEYSVDGGANWLPLVYMVKNQSNDDLILTPDLDPVATLGTARNDQAWDLAYNAFIGATVDASFGPYISGRVDDDAVGSKRIEVLSMPQAANQANVRLRFTHTGTGSWYFGIDDVGIYGDGGVNKQVVFASQPQGGTIAANTPALLVAGVDPTSTRPLSFQWTRNGTNVAGATLQSYAIASMQPDDAGDYRLIVSNVSGSQTSQVATLNYLLPLPPTITQDPTNRAVETDLIGTFTVTATGTEPLSYQWYFGASAIAGATSATLNLQHVDATNSGSYYVVVTNNYGAKTSLVATLTVLPAQPVEITGQWDFDCGTLQATAGNDLVPFNASVLADTQFGTTTSFAIGDIGGSPASVLYFTNSTANWGGYQMYHGALPNGGGSYVNRYTVIYDVYYPTASNSKWRSFLQTNTGNSNDGDIFVNTSNGIGISGNYSGTVTPDAWHRIVFVFDQTYATLKKYINGTLVGTQTLGGLDSRWTLDPYALLFGDEDGDQAPTYVNSVQFRNGIMTDAEVTALGGATSAAGIPGVVPRICSVTVSGNNVTITWPGQPNVKLRKTTSLTNPNWTDVAGSLGASSANDAFAPGGAYYRLQRQ